MSTLYTTTATLADRNTLILDNALPLTVKRVRVTIEDMSAATADASFLLKLQAIHQMLADSDYQSRSQEAIDKQIRAERESWDE